MESEKNKKRGKYTGEKAQERKKRQIKRQHHIQAVKDGEVKEELPVPLVPETFEAIKTIYWDCLKSVPDPRNPDRRVYPLHLILHRIISGFMEGTKHIGVLFPKKRQKVTSGKKKLGALPTRKVVYSLLRRIDWKEANEILAPLWEQAGYTPDLVVRRKFRTPKEILEEFQNERESAELERRKEFTVKRETEERSKGMSAAKAKRSGLNKSKNDEVSKSQAPSVPIAQDGSQAITIQHNLVIDGKVVKASYNSGVAERFVHVTEIREDENDNRSRFIIGAQPTVLDRNGEWGAAISILDALTPLPGDRVVIVSGDAGFCVEKFCEWLNEKGFFLPLSNKTKCR